ncbi:MAG: hypothetical protein IT315_06850 [Anaerolineales bacterium]|nr:hypothetical protein [Anaerolineales bacterium]
MNKTDTRTLKKKHRIELVMQEAGERFEADPKYPNILRSTVTPGLIVNTNMQAYELTRPGVRKTDSGDVIAWLRSRYSWSFTTALKFLQKRPPDPADERVIRVRQSNAKTAFEQSDYVIETVLYTDPVTGRQDRGYSINYSIMDALQKRALDLWHDAYKYFNKRSDEVWDKLQNYPSRFKPVIDFEVDKCANCETPFDWQAGAVAYAEEKSEFITIYGESDEEINGRNIDFTGQMAETDELFIDQGFVICEKCMRGIYAPHYKALLLCYRSACRREEAREEEHRQKERERAKERTEYLEYELPTMGEPPPDV